MRYINLKLQFDSWSLIEGTTYQFFLFLFFRYDKCPHGRILNFPGDRRRFRGERRPRTPARGRAAQDRGGPRFQRHGRQGAELTHLHFPHHPRRRGRPSRRPQARRPASLRQRRRKLFLSRFSARLPATIFVEFVKNQCSVVEDCFAMKRAFTCLLLPITRNL